MEIKILCTQWGHEQLPLEEFISNVKEAGYDGIETWLPDSFESQKKMSRLLEQYGLKMVAHQHQAAGNTIGLFCKSFEYHLSRCLDMNPLLINSHSGKDSFSLSQQLKVIDCAENFAQKSNIEVIHETHRGRIGFNPTAASKLFSLRPNLKITADFSHWVCVTESYLQDFEKEINEAIERTRHIHARVGFPEGPQIPDPRTKIWQEPVDFFFKIWDKIIANQHQQKSKTLTITPEFGPPPYMWIDSQTGKPLANQWDVNIYMKDLLKKRYDL